MFLFLADVSIGVISIVCLGWGNPLTLISIVCLLLIFGYIAANWNYCLYIIDVKNEKFYYEEVPIWKPTEDGCWYKIWSCLKGCFRRMTCCNKEEDESNNDDLYSLHRIYIRLQKRLDKDDAVSHYYLSFGGVNIESVRISREDTSILKLREMGKDIANKLNLNYFDYEDKSAHHVIRHRGKNTSK